MVHVKFIETRSQKSQTEKDVSKVKDRRRGISAEKKAKTCQKGESGRSIYTMALMTSKIYDAGWGCSRNILM